MVSTLMKQSVTPVGGEEGVVTSESDESTVGS